MIGPVLVVSGCSGVGKSTVSQLLRTALDTSLHMSSDVFCRFFEDPFPDPTTAEGAHRYEHIGAAQAAAAIQFALGGYTVILDGTIFPEGIDGMADICGRRGVAVHYAVLRADLDTCLERAGRRGPEELLDLDGFKALHARFGNLGHRETNAADACRPAGQVADAVLGAFESDRLLVGQ